jgi:NAD-dependent DNA ligase
LPDPETCEDVSAFATALDGMNEMLFCGFDELDEESRAIIVEHLRDKDNWARLTKRKAPAKNSENTKKTANKRMITEGGGGDDEYAAEDDCVLVTSNSNRKKKSKASSEGSTEGPSTAVALQSSAKQGFSMVATADSKHFLSGKTIVMTGVFPEIGGGAGLSLGKDRLKKMLENFGAKVTGSVSGKTNILIVGEQPGRSKVDKARSSEKCQLIGVADLKLAVEGKQEFAAIEEAEIESFSNGYYGNAIGAIGWERRNGGIGF